MHESDCPMDWKKARVWSVRRLCKDDRPAQYKALVYGMSLVHSKIMRIARFWMVLICRVHSLGLSKPTIKPHPEEKWAWPWVRETPIYLGFPFNMSATAALSS